MLAVICSCVDEYAILGDFKKLSTMFHKISAHHDGAPIKCPPFEGNMKHTWFQPRWHRLKSVAEEI